MAEPAAGGKPVHGEVVRGVCSAPMRRSVLIGAAGLAILAGAPMAGAAPLQTVTPVTVHVTPGSGGPRTTFRLTLRNPFAIGPAATVQRSETVAVNGPHRRGCVWSGVMPVPAAPAQQLVRMALRPSRLAGGGATTWCTGTFRGSVVITQRLRCAPPLMCLMLEIRPQTIARFSFTVTRRS